jgi:uncharacterized protein (DUF2252 family)
MSRAYRISVQESIHRHLRVEDGLCARLELLEILPRERMAELLAAELAELGLERRDALLVRVDGDVEITVDPALATVTVRIAAERELELERKASGAAARPDDEQARAALRAEVQRRLEEEVAEEQKQMQQGITDKLERKLRDLRAELDRATSRVTSAALKERAAQLGEIEEISEDAETGDLTIRVRV